MPYNPSTGVYTLPAVYLAVPGTVIVATQHNTPLTDLQTAQNYERPIIAGGTGAGTAAGARAALGVPSSTTTPSYTAPTVDNQVVRWDGVAGAQQGSPLVVTDAATGSATLTATNDGATGAVIATDHESASPAVSDVIQTIRAIGEDSAGNDQTYAERRVVIVDPTTATEDARVDEYTVIAGTFAARTHTGAGFWMEGATGGDPGAGKINATDVQKNGLALGLTSGTAQATTSGTFKDFLTIPAGVKLITVQYVGVSTNGSSEMLLQIGDSGGIENSGYLSIAANNGGGGERSTAGFILTDGHSSASVLHGAATLTLQDASSNTWVVSGNLGLSNTDFINFFAGSKSLSATLDRVRLTTINGTDAFDAGSVNILYE